jgi:FAD/FMN-containing dehydrogenase
VAIGESWGRFPCVDQTVVTLEQRDRALNAGAGHWLPYGNGRSYGDSCLNAGGTLLHSRRLDHFIAFDPTSGVLRCESGVQLADILSLVLPHGWFLPVSPGTKFVTIGGAIANDVHGKNHHAAGTFGHHVRALELLRSTGERLFCTANQNSDWFAATIGGLGLTGLITWAEIALRRVDGPWLATETFKLRRLSEFFALSEDSNRSYEYTVAWIDCTARGESLGRGLFTRGNHCETGRRVRRASGARPDLPFTPPFSLVNPLSLRAFNMVVRNHQLRHRRARTSHYEPFFYPLDSVANWNRMYGPRGFVQHQCVIPPLNAPDAIAELLRLISADGTGSFLVVLKQFGTRPSTGLLSFPCPGTTLALDFPIDASGRVFELLDRLDGVVADAGGAVYPAKDARMSGSRFKQFFPAWERFQSFIDPRLSSSFWRRVMET